MSGRWRLTRRGFLIGTGIAGGALALGLTVGLPEARLRMVAAFDGPPGGADLTSDPLLWFELDKAGAIRLIVPKVEMGQGVHTALAQIAAEELRIEPGQVSVVQGGTHLGLPDSFGTQGSTSVSSLYATLRRTGATLHAMLAARAATHLSLPASALTARIGYFESNEQPARRVDYSTLVALGGAWEVPEEEVPLRDPGAFDVIGTDQPRVDIPAKVTGQAQYGYDMRVEGMLYGAILRPPSLEATLRRVTNTDEVRALPGVVAVVEEAGMVGVVARSRPQAWAARDALVAEWNEGRRWQQAELDEIVSVGGRGGVMVQREGDVARHLSAGVSVEAEYRTPFAIHAQLEPQAALAEVGNERVRVWASTQSPVATAEQVAEVLGRKAEEIEVMPTFVGGGFGRKSVSTVAGEAARLAKAVGAPVHVGWTREEEMTQGFARPPTHSRLRARLEGGRLLALEHEQASGQVLIQFFPAPLAALLGSDFGAWRGAQIEYAVPHRRVTAWHRALPVPTGPWRGLGLLANVFAIESFMDEVAHAAGADPLQFRLDHLPENEEGQRFRAVLLAAAERAGWGTALPDGRARGLALCQDAGSVVAQVAEVSVGEEGRPRVHRVVAAMDCGLVISPDGARAQVEGNIIWGVGSALIEQMTVRDGRIEPRNFDRYPLLTLRDAPEIEVVLVKSPIGEPRGVGEPAIGPTAAAIANALFALTGTRVRTLPLHYPGALDYTGALPDVQPA